MKVQDRQNGPSGLPEKNGWLRAWYTHNKMQNKVQNFYYKMTNLLTCWDDSIWLWFRVFLLFFLNNFVQQFNLKKNSKDTTFFIY